MKPLRRLPLALFCLALLDASGPAQTPPVRSHGVNLAAGAVNYDCASMPFADLIRSAGVFNGFQRGVAPNPPFDAKGWPKRVDAQTGPTHLLFGLNADLPAGDYTLRARGVGKVRITGGFDGQATREVAFNGDDKPQVLKLARAGVPWGSQLDFQITESSAADPVRDVSFFLPGHAGKTFYQPFLDDLRPFTTLRFMDWQSTNASPLVEWKDRTASAHFSVAGRGRVPEEVCFALASLVKKDPWICIPALASDDYIRKLAELADRLLDPDLTIYVEFSNELWNAFPQAAQLQKKKDAQPQGPGRIEGAWEFAARCDGHATNLFKASLSPRRKCVRVIARQAAYPATLTVALKQYKADGHGFDAISCSGYIYTQADINALAETYKTDPAGAVTKVFQGIDGSIKEYAGYMAWFKQQADANRVPFVMYEAGQHLVNPNNDTSTPLLTAVNRDSRMGGVYTRLIEAFPRGMGPICWYFDSGTYSKWGYWGLKERTGQSPKTAHKYRAVFEDAAAHQIRTARDAPPTIGQQ